MTSWDIIPKSKLEGRKFFRNKLWRECYFFILRVVGDEVAGEGPLPFNLKEGLKSKKSKWYHADKKGPKHQVDIEIFSVSIWICT